MLTRSGCKGPPSSTMLTHTVRKVRTELCFFSLVFLWLWFEIIRIKKNKIKFQVELFKKKIYIYIFIYIKSQDGECFKIVKYVSYFIHYAFTRKQSLKIYDKKYTKRTKKTYFSSVIRIRIRIMTWTSRSSVTDPDFQKSGSISRGQQYGSG